MFKYDICFLCVPQDVETAQTLAESIHNYRMPRNVVLADPALDYRRTIVESSGSMPEGAVKEIMEGSRYLAVICSPRTKPDPAVNACIAHFKKTHNGENVIAVIAEGEPVDSFPETFIERKLVQHIMPDMRIVEREETIEPIASDLRGDTPARRKANLRYETVRITASVLGLHPDDLEQRHRRRRNRAIMTVAAVISAVFLVAAGIFIRLGLIARHETVIAEKQTELSVAAADRMVTELPEMFSDDEKALGYIRDSIEAASTELDEIRSAAESEG